MAEGQDAARKINVTVKTPKTKETIAVDENADIKEVSEDKDIVLEMSQFSKLFLMK